MVIGVDWGWRRCTTKTFKTENIKLIYLDTYEKKFASLVGIEPTTFGLEVQRAILCATGTVPKTVKVAVES